MIAILLAISLLAEKTYTKEEFFSALHSVESGGKLQAPDGDNGKAIGPYQILEKFGKLPDINLT